MFPIVTYIVLVIGVIVFSIISMTITDLYNAYLLRKYEKHCKHWCCFCKYKDRCEWYNR